MRKKTPVVLHFDAAVSDSSPFACPVDGESDRCVGRGRPQEVHVKRMGRAVRARAGGGKSRQAEGLAPEHVTVVVVG
ncbi:MAG: hypothetical protein P8R42_28860 [Candidatus Binatia bacterium]|nr:hypothetical protein [Candidatus Binatia bacterium]